MANEMEIISNAELENEDTDEAAEITDTEEYTEEELLASIESDQETRAKYEDPVIVATADYNIALAVLDLAKKEQRKADRAWEKLPYDVDEAINAAAVARCTAADKAVAEAEAAVNAAEQNLNTARKEAAKIREAHEQAARKAEREALGAELIDIVWDGAFTTAAAIEAAAEAEAEIAAATATTVEETDRAEETMKITTKENANGKITAYYIDGKKVRKAEVEYYACNPAYDGIIEIDYFTAKRNFPNLYNYGLAVVFKNWVDGSDVVTKSAAKRLELKLGRLISLHPAIYRVEGKIKLENVEETPSDREPAPATEEPAIVEEPAPAEVKADQAAFIADKVSRESKPVDDNNDVFSLLPKLEDLNDVEDEFDEDAAEYDGQVTHPDGCVWNSVPFKSYAEAYSWIRRVEAKYPEFKSEITKWDAANYESVIVYSACKPGCGDDDDDELIDPPAALVVDPVKYVATQITFPTGREGETTREISKTFGTIDEAARFLTNGNPLIETETGYKKHAYDGGCYYGGTFFAGFRIETTDGKILATEDSCGNRTGDEEIHDLIFYYSQGYSFAFTFNGVGVTELDSLALAKTLPPEKFFDQEPGDESGSDSLPAVITLTDEYLAHAAEQYRYIAKYFCDKMNAKAPAGWEVSFDNETNSFPVTFNGVGVTELDSLALAKTLPPEKFFDQFKPLVDDDYTPRQQFLDDRYRELHELQAMREELGDDSDRAKILDGLIDRLKRDILDAELETDEPPEARGFEFDENGNAIPCF